MCINLELDAKFLEILGALGALLKPRAQLTHSMCLTDAWKDKSTAPEIVEVLNYVVPNFALSTTLYENILKLLHVF